MTEWQPPVKLVRMRRRLLATLAMVGVLAGSVILGGAAPATTDLAKAGGTVTTSKINRGW